MGVVRAYSQLFVIYLYENNHLDNFTIEKAKAKKLHWDFQKGFNIKIKWGSVFMFILNLLKRTQNLDIMVFNQNRLQKLVEAKPKIELSLKIKTLDHNKNNPSVSYNEVKKTVPQQNSVSPKIQIKTNKSFLDGFVEALKQSNKQQIGLKFTIEGSPTLNNIIIRKNTTKTVNLSIENVSKELIQISSIQTRDDAKEVKFSLGLKCPFVLASSACVQCTLTIDCLNEGILNYPILFKIEEKNSIRLVPVELVFHAHDEFFDKLHPVEAYEPPKMNSMELCEEIDSGERPNIFPPMTMKVPLKQYHLSMDMTMVLNSRLSPFSGMTHPQRCLLNDIKRTFNMENGQFSLQPENYTKALDFLLYFEEHQMNKNIREYDKENQTLQRDPKFLELKVPGLAEHRPSLIISDSVFVKESKNSKIAYQGFVHQVKENSVMLKFSKKFLHEVYIKNKKFYVSFTFNRYPLKVEHQALEFAKIDKITHLFFPKDIIKAPLPQTNLSWFNRDIANNPEQQQAVRAIFNKTSMPSPYIIFGPPGTGKTVTVVECVKQIHRLTSSRILICTPSNNAANEITKRLVNTIPTTDLFRFIAVSFPFSQIPQEILKYTNLVTGVYYQPMMADLIKYRILITTLVTAAKLVNSGCPPNHFDYVFIDESGQATESETIIPIARILSHHSKCGTLSGQIVLAGDPKQLGPVIHSRLAIQYGYAISMLKRLMDTAEPYKKDDSNKYNPNVITKLLQNYRSHPAIIKIPNELFYENELKSCGNHFINVALRWEGLPQPNFPLIFHNVVGLDQREANSPSFFNIQEVQVVMKYLNELKGTHMQGVLIKEEHIGVISPYKKQIEKIKKACEDKYNRNLMVGTVEQIQGQERLIIIISTVRSKTDYLQVDAKFHLGFVNNEKRFNVAITRPKALLIVVGNANLLQNDPNWFSLIKYCKDNNAMIGDKFQLQESKVEEIAPISVDALSVINETNIEDGPSFARGNM